MEIPGKGMTTSLAIMTKRTKNKQKARFAITEITNQDLKKFLKKFKTSPYLGYKSKQVHNEPTGAYFLLIKHINNLIKIERYVRLCTKRVKSDPRNWEV